MADEQKLSFEDALAILDRHAAEEDTGYKGVGGDAKPKKVAKAKDALKAGAKARSGLGSAKRQLDALEKDGY